MPGINVSTGVRVGPQGADAAPSSTLFLTGIAERGPINRARMILSVNQFEAIYGGYTSTATLHDSVRTFFEEGGTRVYVARVLGDGSPTPAPATASILGAASAVSFTVTAASPGTWANSSAGPPALDGLKVITAVASSKLSVTITYRGETIFSAGPWGDEVQPNGDIKSASQFAVEAINGSAALTEYIIAEAGVDVEVIPTAATTNLTSGTNGDAVTAAALVAGLDLFDYDFGPGAVAIPGSSGTTIWDGLRDHAVANRRIALCAFADGETASGALGDSDFNAYYGDTETERTEGSYMAFFWPWVNVPDGFGGTRLQSPEAFAAAARAKAIRSNGPWRAGAGNISTARYIAGLAETVTRTTGDTLDAGRINALRVVNGAVQVYGARSVSADETNWRFITYRDTINYIIGLAENALEPLVFRPIDGRGNLFGEVEAILTAVVDPIRAVGGLYEGFDSATGQPVDPGYSVQASSVNNPTVSLANGVVTADIGVRVSPISDQINVTITKSSLTATV